MTIVRRLAWSIAGVGLGVGLGVLAPAGCQPADSDQFNAELADLVCRINARCPDIDLRADWGSLSFSDDDCEAEVEDHFSSCQGTCEFDRAQARRCLRRLGRVADDCEPAASLGPCRRAYHDCNTSTDENACTLNSCSARVASPPSEGAPLGVLVLLGLCSRRRRAIPRASRWAKLAR